MIITDQLIVMTCNEYEEVFEFPYVSTEIDDLLTHNQLLVQEADRYFLEFVSNDVLTMFMCLLSNVVYDILEDKYVAIELLEWLLDILTCSDYPLSDIHIKYDAEYREEEEEEDGDGVGNVG